MADKTDSTKSPRNSQLATLKQHEKERNHINEPQKSQETNHQRTTQKLKQALIATFNVENIQLDAYHFLLIAYAVPPSSFQKFGGNFLLLNLHFQKEHSSQATKHIHGESCQNLYFIHAISFNLVKDFNHSENCNLNYKSTT